VLLNKEADIEDFHIHCSSPKDINYMYL